MLFPQTLLKHFGLKRTGVYDSPTLRMMQSELADAIVTNQMMAVVGKIGSGKTTLMNRVKASFQNTDIGQPAFVTVSDLTPRHTTLGNILNAIVYDLGTNENPRRDMEARSRQVVRLMGHFAVKLRRPVCIVIEDAHRLHKDSLSALKLLRERDFAGRAPLCSVILIGWPQLQSLINTRKDIKWRTTPLTLSEEHGYMTYTQRLAYLESVFGDAIVSGSREALATQARVPAELNSLVYDAMVQAYHAGFTVLDERIILPASLKDQYDATGASYRTIASVAGVSASTVSDRINDPKDDEYTQRVQDAMRRLRNEQAAPLAATG